jgi:protoporphyrinogen oxidase
MGVGRKELYTRLLKVDALWKEILKDDYVTYQQREGILYKGRILESSSRWQGFRRGMSWGMLGLCGLDFLWSRFTHLFSTPRSYEDYWYGKRGKRFSQIFSQRLREKFKGVNWRDMPPCEAMAASDRLKQTVSDPLHSGHLKERGQPIWRHPERGSGQICEILERKVAAAGTPLKFGAHIKNITTSGKQIKTVTVALGSEQIVYRPKHVISSVPAEIMALLLGFEATAKADPEQKTGTTMSTICVYLFINEPPRFPHAWLKVTCPDVKIGRITNFSEFNGKSVPNGLTCLCVEFFCAESDPLLSLSQEELMACAVDECSRAKLIDPDKCFDYFVLKLPGSNAAANRGDWNSPKQQQLLTFLNAFDNLYFVNRPGTDKAT